MNSKSISRRRFFHATGAAAAALLPSTVLGANERIHLAFIGAGGMGTGHVGMCSQMHDVRIVAVCDVDEAHQRRARDAAGGSPDLYSDFRRVLDRRDVDAVVIATPEHWHPILTLRAFEAGKDVYVEKPLAHNIREGRAVAEGVARHKRICQVGLQQRSGRHWQHAVERIRAGELGRVSMIHAWNAWNPSEMFSKLEVSQDSSPPEGVDYDMWLGPAPVRPFNRLRFHGTWYFFWDYSGGMASGWGVHLFDVVAWAMGHRIDTVSTSGGKYVFDDPRETPDTAEAVFNCRDHVLTYSMRHGNGWRPHGNSDHGIEFFGDKATLQISRSGFQIYREEDRSSRKPYYTEDAEGNNYEAHLRDFFECVRARRQPRCDAETGHVAAVYGHLANISYRTGRTITWDGERESIANDPDASALLAREYREPWTL